MLSKSQEYRRGWPVLCATILGAGTGVAPLMSYSLGALVVPLTQAFGWTRAEVTGAAMFKSIGILIMGAVVGILADRFGARRVALISQVLLAAILLSLPFVLNSSLWTLYVAYLLVAVAGAGTLPMVWSRAIVGWFAASRGMALGLSLVGTGILGALLPTYINWLADEAAWQGAFWGMGALPLVLGIPLALLWFREPSKQQISAGAEGAQVEPVQGAKLGEALKTLCFWQMSVAFFLVAVTVVAVLVHAIPLLTDRGVSRPVAAALAGLYGLAFTAGRLVSGYFLDLFRGPRVAVVMFLIGAFACGLLMIAGDNVALCGLAIVLVGLAGGAEHDVAAYFTAKYFGRLHYGAIYGLLYTLVTLGSGVGPSLAGQVYDVTGGYDAALYGGIGIFIVAAILIGTLKAPAPRPAASQSA